MKPSEWARAVASPMFDEVISSLVIGVFHSPTGASCFAGMTTGAAAAAAAAAVVRAVHLLQQKVTF